MSVSLPIHSKFLHTVGQPAAGWMNGWMNTIDLSALDSPWSELNIRAQSVTLEKAMAPHSSTLAWKIPWTEKPGRLQSMGSWRVGHNWATSLSLFTFMHWRRKWQPTPVFLPGESQRQRSLVGYGVAQSRTWLKQLSSSSLLLCPLSFDEYLICQCRQSRLSGNDLASKLCPTLTTPLTVTHQAPVHRIFQARLLEWVAIWFSGGSSQYRDRTQISCTEGRYFTDWATREAYPFIQRNNIETFFKIYYNFT